jgi:hypothetical protein
VNAGKLYKADGEEFIVDVNYQLHKRTGANWSGELVPKEYKRLSESEAYVIELADGHRCRCSLRRRTNRAVSGVPPLYHYHFSGWVLLK